MSGDRATDVPRAARPPAWADAALALAERQKIGRGDEIAPRLAGRRSVPVWQAP
jgi:hypothetical protein